MMLKLSVIRDDGALVAEQVSQVRSGKFTMVLDAPGGFMDDEVVLYEVSVKPNFKPRPREHAHDDPRN